MGAHLIFTQYFSLLFEVAEKACEMFNKFLYAMNCYFRNLFVHFLQVLTTLRFITFASEHLKDRDIRISSVYRVLNRL